MKKILIAGAGGQGIVSLGKIIAHAVMNEGLNVSCIPSYGPEMRGGCANCCVVYDTGEINSPLFVNADILVAMNKQSLEKYKNRVIAGGVILTDCNIDVSKMSDTQVRIISLPLNSAAEQSGDRKSLNMVALGVLTKLFKDFSLNDIIASVKKVFCEKQKLIATSILALRAGFAMV